MAGVERYSGPNAVRNSTSAMENHRAPQISSSAHQPRLCPQSEADSKWRPKYAVARSIKIVAPIPCDGWNTVIRPLPLGEGGERREPGKEQQFARGFISPPGRRGNATHFVPLHRRSAARPKQEMRGSQSTYAKWYRRLSLRLWLYVGGDVRRGCKSMNREDT